MKGGSRPQIPFAIYAVLHGKKQLIVLEFHETIRLE